MPTPVQTAKCQLCGEPMPPGEEMFLYHGYSGNCPNWPIAARIPLKGDLIEVRRLRGGWERAKVFVVIDDGVEIFATACNAPSGAGLYGRENWRWPAHPDEGFEAGSK